MQKSAIGLVLWLLAALAAGLIGSQFMPGEWYASLAKPSWNPPSSVFGPVWTILCLLMGVAAWLVWREAGFSGARMALSLFIVQLVLNALWSYLFFGLQQPMVAFVEIIVLWCAILATIVGFWQVRPLAGALLIPYLCWVSFCIGTELSALAAEYLVMGRWHQLDCGGLTGPRRHAQGRSTRVNG